MSEKNSMRYNLSTKTTQNPLPPGGGPGWGSCPPLGEGRGGVLFPCWQGGGRGVGIKSY